MMRFNLLPYRDQQKLNRRKRFYITFGLFVALFCATSLLLTQYNKIQLIRQKSRNQFIQHEISQLDQTIQKIIGIRKEREMLLERKQVVENLQLNRSITVLFFNEIVAVLPEEMVIQNLQKTGHKVSVLGLSKSNLRISSFMRNIEQNTLFEKPELIQAISKDVNGKILKEFDLTLKIRDSVKNIDK